MGRPFLNYLDDDAPHRYICASCSCDVATAAALVWEGYMAHQTPAMLFRSVVNVEGYGPEREEQLSTGIYVLADMRCRSCCTALGWRYVSAQNETQKYKEGGTLIQKAKLRRRPPDLPPAHPMSPDSTPPRRQLVA